MARNLLPSFRVKTIPDEDGILYALWSAPGLFVWYRRYRAEILFVAGLGLGAFFGVVTVFLAVISSR